MKLKKKVAIAVTTAMIAVQIFAVNAFAESGAVDWTGVTSALTGGLGSVATNTLAMVSVALPIGLGIWGVMIAINQVKKFFTKVTGN